MIPKALNLKPLTVTPPPDLALRFWSTEGGGVTTMHESCPREPSSDLHLPEAEAGRL